MNETMTGQFIPRDSLLHRLGAGCKLICFLLILVCVVNAQNAAQYALVLVPAALCVALSRLPLAAALSSLWRIRWFLLTVFLMNALFFGGNEIWWSFWIFRIGPAGLVRGFSVAAHVMLLVVFSNLLTCTTAPLAITGALQKALSPLAVFHVPVDLVCLILSSAIGFIPTLTQESDMIKKAQIARGARFESRRLHERAASFLPLLIPIFLCAFRRADELAMAMEARGYEIGGVRTAREKSAPKKRDVAAVFVCILLCAAQIGLSYL